MTTLVQIKTLDNEKKEVQVKSDCTINEVKSQLLKDFGYERKNQIFFNNSAKLDDETNISTLNQPISLILYLVPNFQTSLNQKQIQKQEKENTITLQKDEEEKEQEKEKEKEEMLRKEFKPFSKLETYKAPVSQNRVSFLSTTITTPVIHYVEKPKVILNYNDERLRELIGMGFEKERCKWALHETRNDLQRSLEWLFNKKNTVRSRTNSVKSNNNNTNNQRQTESERKIQNIVNLGFPRQQVIQMLEICNGSQEQAINLLLGSNF
ncbi:hypothetical protein M0812_12684 [Anaeramoeba flamelloides]|uniref:UBA domain-containing protein n=1 Tax=Anaeramoeba flamelloides TaxID=1746091 RepID=A0AAV7ZLS0_9EUKA|nr:hypothetical protein M0812_12684 [Anaeramoeba flamelloides]